MDRPRLIYYNDGHHFHAKRIEPPASLHMLQWPVDEVAGTGVDLLILGLGYSDVYFHDSKVGRVVGQRQEVWDSYIDWRIMRMVEEGRKLGTDQVREVTKRGRELGVRVFPSLKLQDVAAPGSERCGLLKWERGAEVCIGAEGRYEWAYDFAVEAVRQAKLAVVREILEEYEAEGIELDFMFDCCYFRADQVEACTLRMTEFVRQVRSLAEEVGRQQQRQIGVMARVALDRDRNLEAGLDVESWLREGSLDYVVGQDDRILTDTQPKPRWLPESAQAAGAAAYYRPPRRVYHESVGVPSIEMYRALGQTLDQQGYAGLYHGYMPWPLADTQYQFLREAAYPEVCRRRPKRYYLQPREGASDACTTPDRVLPADLKEGETISARVWVADDVDGARRDGELRRPILTLRFACFCIEDEVEVRCNGRVLSLDEAEITDERALTMATRLAGGMEIQAPPAMSAHWFRFRLEQGDVQTGENVVEVDGRRLDRRAGFARSLSGVEIFMRYRDYERPEGLRMERVDPPNG
ncbi:hypothetical protein ACFL6X_05995 [Candidatus Latescibacterota bacterium]